MWNVAIAWIVSVATARLIKSTHDWRKKHAEGKISIHRMCKIKDDALDRRGLIFNEDYYEEAEENLYEQFRQVCEKKLCLTCESRAKWR